MRRLDDMERTGHTIAAEDDEMLLKLLNGKDEARDVAPVPLYALPCCITLASLLQVGWLVLIRLQVWQHKVVHVDSQVFVDCMDTPDLGAQWITVPSDTTYTEGEQ
jgi:hypothetical protein